MEVLSRLLLRIPVMRQFLDVVYQAVKLPLRIHFVSPSEREPVELFVVPQVSRWKYATPSDSFHIGRG